MDKKYSLPLVFALGAAAFAAVSADKPADKAPKTLWTEKTDSERAHSGTGVDPAALNKVFVDLAQGVGPTVVNIYTKTKVAQPGRGSQEDLFRFFFGNPYGAPDYRPPAREAQALGSGFVISPDGYVVTNSHVVRQSGRTADSILVKFNTESANSQGHEAKVIGVDELTDVAVLKLKEPPKDLKSAPLGNSDKVKVGEWVVAIGNPYGHSSSVTKGIVSALGRSLDGLNRAAFLQTDASINPGNSGGPLFNLYGEVIGINTAIDARAQGIGFAIPINVAKGVIRQLVEKGEVTLGYIGVVPMDLTPEIAEQLGLKNREGVLVQEVSPGDPADRGGLQAYDVVEEVNGRRVESAFQFRSEVAAVSPGGQARLTVRRDGREVKLVITVAKRPSAQELARRQEGLDGAPAGARSVGKTGLMLGELSPQLRQQLGVDPSVRGVLVMKVRPGSAVSEVLAPGDVIQEINRKPVKSVAEAERALGSSKKSFLLKIRRGAGSVIAFLDLSDDGSGASEQEE